MKKKNTIISIRPEYFFFKEKKEKEACSSHRDHLRIHWAALLPEEGHAPLMGFPQLSKCVGRKEVNVRNQDDLTWRFVQPFSKRMKTQPYGTQTCL